MLVQTATTQHEHRLLREMDRVQTDLEHIGSRCTRHFDGVGDIVDQASHAVGVDIDRALHCLHQQELGHLEQAWDRFCRGQHGICESCGDQIDPARLDAIPYATLCVGCQRRSEQQGQHNHWAVRKRKPP